MKQPEADGATRRAILTAGVTAGSALTTARVQAAAGALDLSTPKGRLRAYMLMRGALDARLVIGFINGRYYGVVENEIKPLYGVVGATFARYRPRADGGYDGATYEVPYFADLITGAALDTYRNPYTGEEVDVVNSGYPPSTFIVTKDLEILTPKSPPGLSVRDRVIATDASSGNIWMTEETTSAFTIPGVQKPIRYSEVTSVHALAADFRAPDVKSVPCQTAYTSVVSWRPWLKMGDHPGHLMGVGVGRYGVTMTDLPQAWRIATAARHPDVLTNPNGPLAGMLPMGEL